MFIDQPCCSKCPECQTDLQKISMFWVLSLLLCISLYLNASETHRYVICKPCRHKKKHYTKKIKKYQNEPCFHWPFQKMASNIARTFVLVTVLPTKTIVSKGRVINKFVTIYALQIVHRISCKLFAICSPKTCCVIQRIEFGFHLFEEAYIW